MEVLEAKCAKCGVSVAITDIRSAGHSFIVKPPGSSLDDLCPVIIERKMAGKPPTENACPNLAEAIDARIKQFQKEQS